MAFLALLETIISSLKYLLSTAQLEGMIRNLNFSKLIVYRSFNKFKLMENQFLDEQEHLRLSSTKMLWFSIRLIILLRKHKMVISILRNWFQFCRKSRKQLKNEKTLFKINDI